MQPPGKGEDCYGFTRIQKTDGGDTTLYANTRALFGGWPVAVRAASLDYDAIRSKESLKKAKKRNLRKI